MGPPSCPSPAAATGCAGRGSLREETHTTPSLTHDSLNLKGPDGAMDVYPIVSFVYYPIVLT